MASIRSLLAELEESTIARNVGLRHDEARMAYALRSNTVSSFDEYERVIGDYYNYHFTRCISNGGRLSFSEAVGRAKEIIEREYRRKGGDIVGALHDAMDSVNGGMRTQLDLISESLKGEAVELYIRDAFDRHVAPNSWTAKIDILREFIHQCGPFLSPRISVDQIERYGSSYKELIRAYVEGLRRTSSVFRRM